MKIINKLKNNNGSAMVLALILMLLVSIVIVMFSSQISNGFRLTNRNYDDLKAKYVLEAGIEHGIGNVYTNIDDGYKTWKVSNFGIGSLNEGDEIVFAEPDNKDLEKTVIKNIIISKINEKELGYEIQKIDDINIKLRKCVETIRIKNKGRNKYKKIYYIYQYKANDNIKKDIMVKYTYKGKEYSMKSNVEFEIENLNTGNIKYTIKSWE